MKYIYYALLLSGLIALLMWWKRTDRRLHLFVSLYFSNIVTEVIADVWHVYFPYHINQTIGCFLLFAYYHSLFRQKNIKKWVWIAFSIYLTFFTVYFIQKQGQFLRFDPIDFVVEGVFITLFSLYYLIELYRSNEQILYLRHPHFWITIGNLLFYSGASFFMGYAFTLSKENMPVYTQLSYIVYFLNLMLYSLYLYAFICHLSTKKLS